MLRLLSKKWVAPALVALVLTLIVGLVVVAVRVNDDVAAKTEDTEVDCTVAVRDDAQEAGEVAEACDIDVEIAGERTPWETSWATAEGHSRLEVTAQPASTNVNGEWEDIDPTIADTPDADGMLPSIAPVYRVAFNPGGQEGAELPLAEIEREGATSRCGSH